jgi:iron(III) transport system substrate-binding protein
MGILARFPTPATDKMLPQFKGLLDKHNRWIVYSWNEQGISYNTRMVKEADAPKDWFDLCKPQFKGEIGIEQRGRFLIFMHMMMGEEKLKEWLTCFGKNDPIIMRGATVRLELMLAGDHSVEGANSFYRGMEYIRSKGADKVPFKPVYSTPIMAQPSGCFINRMSPRPYTAALYCDMQLSDATQKYLFDQFRNPVTMPSPFMPTEAQLITVGPMAVDFVAKLHGYWQTSVGTKK